MELVNGSKEIVVVDLVDKTGAITDLTAFSPTFTVENNAGAVVQASTAAGGTLMRLLCLVNTTTGGPWVEGLHRVYVSFTVGSEIPKVLGGQFYLI